jgi:protein XagA
MSRRAISFVPFLLVLVSVAPVSAGPWGLAPGQWYSEFRGSLFTADSWHNDAGDRLGLYGGGTVEQRTLVSYNELGWKKKTSFILGVPVKSISRRESPGSFQRTETGLGDALIGFRYQIKNGPTAVSIQADWKAPLGYNRHVLATHQDSIRAGDASGNGDSLNVDFLRQTVPQRLGEGQQDLGIGIGVGKSLPGIHAYAQAFGGYRYRFDDPADQFVTNAEVGFWLTRAFLLGGRYEGEIATGKGNVKSDEVTRHRVGPKLLYRIDDSVDLFVESMHTARANNAFHTDEIFVGAAFKRSTLDRLQGALGTLASP